MATLYELSAEFVTLKDQLGDGELIDADLDLLIESNAAAIEAKAAGYLAVLRTLDSEALALRTEAKKLDHLARNRENGAERLRARLVYCMDLCKIERLPTPLGTIRVQQASRPTIRWVRDETEIPHPFRRVKVELNGQNAYEVWRMTKELPDGFRVEFSRGIRVS